MSRVRDLRGLSREDRERVRWGEKPRVESPEGVVEECCGELMVYSAGNHYCQSCGRLERPVAKKSELTLDIFLEALSLCLYGEMGTATSWEQYQARRQWAYRISQQSGRQLGPPMDQLQITRLGPAASAPSALTESQIRAILAEQAMQQPRNER